MPALLCTWDAITSSQVVPHLHLRVEISGITGRLSYLALSWDYRRLALSPVYRLPDSTLSRLKMCSPGEFYGFIVLGSGYSSLNLIYLYLCFFGFLIVTTLAPLTLLNIFTWLVRFIVLL